MRTGPASTLRRLTARLVLPAVAAAQPAGGDAAALVPTRVRVVGPDGRGVVNARVLWFEAPLPGVLRYYRGEVHETRTGARGHVRIPLDPAAQSRIWAVHDDAAGRRFASLARAGVVPGRPLRLELHPWSASRLLVRCAEWRRDRRGKDLRLGFAADPVEHWVGWGVRSSSYEDALPVFGVQTPGFQTPLFLRSLPEAGQDLGLPPLPYGFYFLFVTDPGGGFLDGRWITHGFLAQPTTPGSYDREARRKILTFGGPGRATLELVGEGGRPVPGARILLRSTVYQHGLRREYGTDAKGRADLLLPSSSTGSRSCTAVVLAAGFRPQTVRVAAGGPSPQRVKLQPGPLLTWRVRGLDPADRLLLATEGETLQVAADGGGKLRLPTPAEPAASFELFLLRGRQAIPLFLGAGTPPADRTFSVGKLATVDLEVTLPEGGTGGGAAFVYSRPRAARQQAASFPIGRDGRCRMKLFPGAYEVCALVPRRGTCVAAVDVAGKRSAHKLVLRPFLRLRGRTYIGGEAAGGVYVFAYGGAGLLGQMLTQTALSDAGGGFSLVVPAGTAGLSLAARKVAGGPLRYATSSYKVVAGEELRVDLR